MNKVMKPALFILMLFSNILYACNGISITLPDEYEVNDIIRPLLLRGITIDERSRINDLLWHLDQAVEAGDEVRADLLANCLNKLRRISGGNYLGQLKVAAEMGYSEVVRILLIYNSENTKDVLEVAAQNGHTEVLELILDNYYTKFVRGDYWGKDDLTAAFTQAYLRGHAEIIRQLLNFVERLIDEELLEGTLEEFVANLDFEFTEEGADNEVKLLLTNLIDDAVSQDPLFCEDPEVVRVRKLLGKKRVSSRLLYEAARNNHIESFRLVFKYLIRLGDPVLHTALEGVPTPLYGAAENGHVWVVRMLLANDAEVNADCDGKTPLYIAAENGHTAVVRVLLESDADIHQGFSGLTPLDIAARNCHAGVVNLLLQWNEKSPELASYTDDQRCDALFAALASGHEGDEIAKVVILFLENGIDTEANDVRTRTLLYRAAELGLMPVIKLLLNYGADKDMRCNRISPLQIAATKGHYQVVKLLLEREASLHVEYRALNAAKKAGHKKIVALLLRERPDIEHRDPNDKLYEAVLEGRLDATETLYHKGVDLALKYDNGATLLHAAAELGHLDVVNFLLENNADTDLKDEYENTPLHLAAANGHLGVVRALLERRANVLSNAVGQKPYHLVERILGTLKGVVTEAVNTEEIENYEAILGLFKNSGG